MVTELMIVLIVVGSIMVFVVWNNSRQRRQRAEEQRVVLESTEKMKAELERTASEVIQRLETQASNLENLLEDADRNRTEFEGRLAELKKVIKRGESQATEIKTLLQKLSDAGENVEDLQRKLDAIELKISTRLTMPVQVPMPMIQQVPAPISPPPMLRQTAFPPTAPPVQPVQPPPVQPVQPVVQPVQSVQPEPIVEPPVEEPSNEARDFAAVLQRSMAEAQDAALAKRVKPIADRPSIVLPSSDKKSNVVEGRPVKIEPRASQQSTARPSAARPTQRASAPAPQRQQAPRGAQPTAAPQRTAQQPPPQRSTVAPQAQAALNAPNSVKIKNMLLEGKTVEDIARELGMGRGAVELVQEMTRRLLDRRKAP